MNSRSSTPKKPDLGHAAYEGYCHSIDDNLVRTGRSYWRLLGPNDRRAWRAAAEAAIEAFLDFRASILLSDLTQFKNQQRRKHDHH